ncbi:hypothetical protein WDW89_20100 [Deltaproteobacteria bacterium TL4]
MRYLWSYLVLVTTLSSMNGFQTSKPQASVAFFGEVSEVQRQIIFNRFLENVFPQTHTE